MRALLCRSLTSSSININNIQDPFVRALPPKEKRALYADWNTCGKRPFMPPAHDYVGRGRRIPRSDGGARKHEFCPLPRVAPSRRPGGETLAAPPPPASSSDPAPCRPSRPPSDKSQRRQRKGWRGSSASRRLSRWRRGSLPFWVLKAIIGGAGARALLYGGFGSSHPAPSPWTSPSPLPPCRRLHHQVSLHANPASSMSPWRGWCWYRRDEGDWMILTMERCGPPNNIQ
jgi:hypothetical protein